MGRWGWGLALNLQLTREEVAGVHSIKDCSEAHLTEVKSSRVCRKNADHGGMRFEDSFLLVRNDRLSPCLEVTSSSKTVISSDPKYQGSGKTTKPFSKFKTIRTISEASGCHLKRPLSLNEGSCLQMQVHEQSGLGRFKELTHS